MNYFILPFYLIATIIPIYHNEEDRTEMYRGKMTRLLPPGPRSEVIQVDSAWVPLHLPTRTHTWMRPSCPLFSRQPRSLPSLVLPLNALSSVSPLFTYSRLVFMRTEFIHPPKYWLSAGGKTGKEQVKSHPDSTVGLYHDYITFPRWVVICSFLLQFLLFTAFASTNSTSQNISAFISVSSPYSGIVELKDVYMQKV